MTLAPRDSSSSTASANLLRTPALIAVPAQLGDHADPHAAHVGLAGRGHHRRDRRVDRGGVARVVAAHGLVQQGGVQHGPPERPGRIQAARERDHPVPGGTAVGGLGADDAADRGGLADRAAGVGADGQRRLVGRHRGGGPAGRTARDLVQVPRVAAGTVRGVLGGRAHGELVHVGLAEDDRAGLLESFRDGGVVRRVPALQDAAPARGGHPGGGEDVLDRDRDARQRA